MSTQPMPLMSTAGQPASDDYRLRAASEIRVLLHRFAEEELPLTLATPDGLSYTTCVWADDAERAVLVLAADPADARVQRLVEADEAVAVGYLDDVKVQFDLQGLMLVRGRDASALHARFPQVIYRFQRRDGFRVRPVGHKQPEIELCLPAQPELLLTLRVMDLSHGGVSLYLPPGHPAVAVGTAVAAASLALDVMTQVQVSLRVVHVASLAQPLGGARLGCEIQGLSSVASRTLQRYIDQTQKRQRLLSV